MLRSLAALPAANIFLLFIAGTLAVLAIERVLPPAALPGGMAAALAGAALLAYANRRQASGELEILSATAAEMTRNLSTAEIVQTIVTGVDRLVRSDVSLIVLRTPEAGELHVAYHRGPDGQGFADDAGQEALTGFVLRTGRSLRIGDYHRDPHRNPRVDAVYGRGVVRSVLALPLGGDGEVWGVMALARSFRNAFTDRHERLLTMLMGQAALAIRNAHLLAASERRRDDIARLYNELSKAHDELRVLFEASKAVASTLDLSALLETLISVTCRTFHNERSALLLVDQDTGDLVVEAAHGYPEPLHGVRLPAGSGISGWVARSGSPLVVDDVLQDPRYVAVDDRTRSELAVPLIAEGKVIGVLNVESARRAAFGPQDVNLLTTLASYAVIAIQNARLYEKTRRMAITDGLTELYNHRYLHDALDRMVERARRDGEPLSLVMLEIDRFKHFNDSYGHRSGDDVLRTIAMLLRRGSRPGDIVARYGGDEFMVVLPGAGQLAAHEIAERLRRAVESYPLLAGSGDITTVTLSIGVATFPGDGAGVDALVEAVDRAQYAAKRSGGNQVCLVKSA